MKKNIFIKGILVLVVITLLAIGFTGCVPPPTGTVYISIANDNWWYDIYIGGIFQGKTSATGNLTIYNVPIGNHFFQAYDTSWLNLYGSKWQYINYGSNTVTIWVY